MGKKVICIIMASIMAAACAGTAFGGELEFAPYDEVYEESGDVSSFGDVENGGDAILSYDEVDQDVSDCNNDVQDFMNAAEDQQVGENPEDESDSIPNDETSGKNCTEPSGEYETAEETVSAGTAENESAEEVTEEETGEDEASEMITEEEEVTEEALYAGGVVSTGAAGDSCTWTLYEDGTLAVSGTGAICSVNVDLWYSGSPISEIVDQVKRVVIQDGITSLGKGFFQGDCYSGVNITEFIIADSVTTIGDDAFCGVSGLTSIYIPAGVTTIEEGAFAGCPLASINVDPANPYYCSVDGVLYDRTMSTLIKYPSKKTDTAFTVPASVARISRGAFCGNASLTAVSLPEGLTSIGSSAFARCDSLAEIVIPDGVTAISYCTFFCCSRLKRVTIGKNVNSIGSYAFQGCQRIEYIYIPKSIWTVASDAFENVAPDAIEYEGTEDRWKLIFGENIFNMDNITFLGNSDVSNSGIVNDTVNWALDDQGQLLITGSGEVDNQPWNKIKDEIRSIVIGEGITYIGNSAFYGCSNLTSVTINEGVTRIDTSAFYNCGNLTDVKLPSTLKTISYRAFGYDSCITNISYAGTEAQWEKVNIADGNTYISEQDVICSDTDVNKVLTGTAVQKISLDHTEEKMAYGSQLQLTATVLPATAANKKVKWESSATWVATVDENGLVTAVGDSLGTTAVISAITEDGGLIAKCSIEVYFSGASEKGYVPTEGVFPEVNLTGSAAGVDTSLSVIKGKYTITDSNVIADVSTDKGVSYHSGDEIVYDGTPIKITDLYGLKWDDNNNRYDILLDGSSDVKIELSGSNVTKKLVENGTSKVTYLTLGAYDYGYASYATNVILVNLDKRLGTPLYSVGEELAYEIPIYISLDYSLEEVQQYSSASAFVNGTGFWNSDEKYTEKIGTLESCSSHGISDYEGMLEYVKYKMQDRGAAGYIVKNENGVPCYYIYFNFTKKQVIDAWAAEMDSWEGHWQKFAFGIIYDADGNKTTGTPGYNNGNCGNTLGSQAVGAYTAVVNSQYEYTITGPGTVTVKMTGVNLVSGSSVTTITVNEWKKIDGAWYYCIGDHYATGWQKVNGTWYYLQPSGAMATGWQKVNGTWYYLQPSGAMATGWQKINGTWYYLQSSGAMATGWQNLNGTWYYLQSSGAMATGWLNLNGTWYYLQSSGAMATGWLNLNGTWYYFQSSGALKQ